MYPTRPRFDGTEVVDEYRARFSVNDKVQIANFGAPFRDDWRVLRTKNGISGDWMGNCATPEEALTLGE
jgi:hypothetical protein